MHYIITKNLAVSMVVGAMLGFIAPINLNAITAVNLYTEKDIEQEKTADEHRAYHELALDEWMSDLIHLESEGRTDIKILDVNGRYSYGCLQFQMRTFVHYGEMYGIISEQDDPTELIYDCNTQKGIARAMILDDPNNWRHWYTSVAKRKLGPPPAPPRELAQNKI